MQKLTARAGKLIAFMDGPVGSALAMKNPVRIMKTNKATDDWNKHGVGPAVNV